MFASPVVPRIGVSACLLGQEVRFDGGHKRDDFVCDTLAPFVEFVSVCPEVELGMGTPREAVRLVQIGRRTHMVGIRSGADHTDAMARYAALRVAELAAEDLSGYILKKNSPSCGMERVRLYDINKEGAVPTRLGVGLFAAALSKRLPLLPIEEEGRLCDPWLRENFVERVYGYARVRELFTARWRIGDVLRFHFQEKLLLMAHDQSGQSGQSGCRGYRALSQLVTQVRDTPRADFATRYQALFMAAFAKVARTRQQGRVLLHAANHFKKLLDDDGRAELAALIADYQAGLVPLIVPMTLLRHYVRLHALDYLKVQTWLTPHPRELMLRNHL